MDMKYPDQVNTRQAGGYQGLGAGGLGSECLMATGFFLGDENVLDQIEMAVAQHCEYTTSHQIVYFKIVNFVLCEDHLKIFFKKSIPGRGTSEHKGREAGGVMGTNHYQLDGREYGQRGVVARLRRASEVPLRPSKGIPDPG